MGAWATEDWSKHAGSTVTLNPALVATTREACLAMLQQAAAHGAQAIVGVRDAAPMGDLERVVMVYGRAVTVRRISKE